MSTKPTHEVLIDASLAGLRLDTAVAKVGQLSKQQAKKLIGAGGVYIGRRCVKIAARLVRLGQRLTLTPLATLESGDTAALPTPNIIYMDGDVLAVNKPSLLLSEPDRSGAPSMVQCLAAYQPLWLVHRLDAGTSGVLLLARRRSMARVLYAAFAQRQVEKTYWALCQGNLPSPQRIDLPLARVAGRHGVHAHGSAAVTHIAAVLAATQAEGGMVVVQPETGRTHQIRVHLAALQTPIVGDRLYGGAGYLRLGTHMLPLRRPMLHAQKLLVSHPRSGQILKLQAPPPQDFKTICENWGIELPADTF